MISELYVNNYRCFSEHTVYFKTTTIIVGKNNAGKSTLIEALRLISLVANRIKTSRFVYPPKWTNLHKVNLGISPSLEKIEFSSRNVINQYNDPPAVIRAKFDNSETIEIRLNDNGEIFAFVRNDSGVVVNSRKEARNLKSTSIEILPQISPLLEEEKGLEESYVKTNVYSSLTSRHFRNQLSYFYNHYNKFKKLSEETWDGLRIVQLTKASKLINSTDPSLLVQEGGFVTEIGSMGHGLQMWLQTMWFIARTSNQSSIVLDEPDVYMHADLQRKLIRTLKRSHKQVIIATHSLEIMAEVNADNILVIDRNKNRSHFASDLPEIQKIIYNDIGSIHNLELAKLWSSRKFLMVEGDDISILKRIQNTVIPISDSPIDSIPSSDIGGWGGWKYAIGSKFVLKNSGDVPIKIYCLLDSDYHIPPDKDSRLKEAKNNGISLHIWNKKEIENYLIVPQAILRIILKKKPILIDIINLKKLNEVINNICESLKDELIDDFASEIGKFFRKANRIIDFTNNDKELTYEAKNINRVARKHVNNNWNKKLNIVPGKKLLRELNKWLAENHKVSFGTIELSSELQKNEIDNELRIVLINIDKVKDINCKI